MDLETIKPRDLCYQCSKRGTDCLFGKLIIQNFNDEPIFSERIMLISSQIQMNMLFNTDERKGMRCYNSKHNSITFDG